MIFCFLKDEQLVTSSLLDVDDQQMKDTLWIVCERTQPSTPSECDREQRVNGQQDHMFSAQVKHSRVSKHERETF